MEAQVVTMLLLHAPTNFTLFERTDDVKTLAAHRLVHWHVQKTVKLSQLEAC